MDAVFQATDNLAKKTCSLGLQLFIKQEMSKEKLYLNANEFTRVDAVVFATFLNQCVILTATKNRKLAQEVTTRYASFVCQILEEDGGSMYGDEISARTIRALVDNRFSFYTEILQSKADASAGIAAMMEEFELIIKTDIINGKFQEFSSISPLPILNFDDDWRCSVEARNFPKFMNEVLDAPMQALLKLIQ